MAFSRNGATAYVAFSRSNALAAIHTAKRTISRQIDVDML